MAMFSILLVIREMKIKTSVRYLFTFTKMVKIAKPDNTKSTTLLQYGTWYMEQLKLSNIVDGNVEWYSNLRKGLAVFYEVRHIPTL